MGTEIQFVIAALAIGAFVLGYRHGVPQSMQRNTSNGLFVLGVLGAVASGYILVTGGPVLLTAVLLVCTFLIGLVVGLACGPNGFIGRNNTDAEKR